MMATLIKLLLTKMVASSCLGLDFNRFILFRIRSFSFSRDFISFGAREKNATSEAEIRAEQNNSTSKSTTITLTENVPAKIAATRGNNTDRGGSVSKYDSLVYNIMVS
jgi:hypothetical protein